MNDRLFIAKPLVVFALAGGALVIHFLLSIAAFCGLHVWTAPQCAHSHFPVLFVASTRVAVLCHKPSLALDGGGLCEGESQHNSGKEENHKLHSDSGFTIDCFAGDIRTRIYT